MPTRKPSPKPKAAAPAPTKRAAHRPPHDPTKMDRDTVSIMVAGGIGQKDIARARGISEPTLRKYYKKELATGATELNTIAIIAHVKLIRAGDFHAIKWWQQARMGWSERIVVDDGKPADTPMRVIVELVGEAAAPRVEQSAPRSGSRLSENLRQTVQLMG
jgi:AraC-like DNA-binding protein